MEQSLATNRGKIHKKSWSPKFGPNGPKLDQKVGFSPFVKFGSLVFLKIA